MLSSRAHSPPASPRVNLAAEIQALRSESERKLLVAQRSYDSLERDFAELGSKVDRLEKERRELLREWEECSAENRDREREWREAEVSAPPQDLRGLTLDRGKTIV